MNLFFALGIKPGNLSRKNKPKQDKDGKYLEGGQSACVRFKQIN